MQFFFLWYINCMKSKPVCFLFVSFQLILGCPKENEPDNRKTIFITQDSYFVGEEGYPSFIGRNEADTICSAEAFIAHLITEEEYRNRKYKAWLSAYPFKIIDEIEYANSEGSYFEYYTPDDNYIGTIQDLINGSLSHTVSVTALGETLLNNQSSTLYTSAWTGIRENGINLELNCQDWKSGGVDFFTIVGDINSTFYLWNYAEELDCSGRHYLYCIEAY